MRAIGFEENGGPEVLRTVEVPTPDAGPGEVLVRVAYAGVNYAEVQHRLGDFGPPDPLDIPGMEASGHIAALGENVSGLAVGDPVAVYLPDGGGYAEYAVARPASPSRWAPHWARSTCGPPAESRSSCPRPTASSPERPGSTPATAS
ncbi:alcohol dehydrogenase catalytic domain-containing protein [Streptomyces sp. NPDC058252]|uniref:alcohol dehydrogenase catalytic domain-containing protein n=1 Tax=unclassified Streptomyces TaxID=2593676 RepID=UPI0036EC89B9